MLDSEPDSPGARFAGIPHHLIQNELGDNDVTGSTPLALWALPHKGYKKSSTTPAAAARQKRVAIMGLFERDTAGWMVVTDDIREACVQSDDQLDAFVSALVACAVATDVTIKPRLDQRGAAEREGWIHLPSPDSIRNLAPAAV